MIVARSARDVVLTAPLTVAGPAPGPRAGVDRRLLAVDFDDHDGVTIVDATRTAGDAVTSSGSAATLWFRAVDLSGAASVEVEVACDVGDPGDRVEFWSGSVPLAEIPVPATGDRYLWTTASAALSAPLQGVHDLRVVLHGGFRLAAFRFTTAG